SIQTSILPARYELISSSFFTSILTPLDLSNVSGSTWADLTKTTPLCCNCFSASRTTSQSSVGNIQSEYSIIVTSTPKSASSDAHSLPMTPPPTIMMYCEKFCICNASSDVMT